jgi:hypothetical protein
MTGSSEFYYWIQPVRGCSKNRQMSLGTPGRRKNQPQAVLISRQLEALKGITGAYERHPVTSIMRLLHQRSECRGIEIHSSATLPPWARQTKSSAECLRSDRKFCLDNNTQLYLMSVPTERIVQICIELKNLNLGRFPDRDRNCAGRVCVARARGERDCGIRLCIGVEAT